MDEKELTTQEAQLEMSKAILQELQVIKNILCAINGITLE